MNYEHLQTQLFNRLEQREQDMIDLRRHMHEYPEISFEEEKTAQYIEEFYKGKDVSIKTNVGCRGIIVDIKGSQPGPTIALRADFDALPIQEETDLPFASKHPGIMHSCGHDAHTAYLLVLADVLIELKEELAGTIRIIHQPAEEKPPGGAIGMIQDGCLEGVDKVLGSHILNNVEVGKVMSASGPIMTGNSTFFITMYGKGGHGSMPHDANDTIVAGAHFVTAVQTIVSRRMNPLEASALTIGSFDAAGTTNIIKDSIKIAGDIRVMSDENRYKIEKHFRELLDGICQAFGITYDLEFTHGYPVLVNDKDTTDQTLAAIEQAHINEVTHVFYCPPFPASEDFAYYAQEKPSCFFYVGAKLTNQPYYPHHHPKFDFDERSLLISAKTMGSAVLNHLFT